MTKVKSPKKILIVEDDDDQIMIYQTALKGAGYSVFVAKNCEEASQIVKKESPSLILLDLLLEKENGMSFLKKAGQKIKKCKVKIVVLSNFSKRDVVEKCKALGALDFISKIDLLPKDLAGKIKDYL